MLCEANMEDMIPIPAFDDDDVTDFIPREEESYSGIPYMEVTNLKALLDEGACVKIFDCRFPYEYRAGHIIGATNMTSIQQLRNFFERHEDIQKRMQSLGKTMHDYYVCFHCEFSANRGPSFAMMFREIDRIANSANYPSLHFPKIYIIRGGYKHIHEMMPSICGGTYKAMRTDENILSGELREYNNRFIHEVDTFKRQIYGNHLSGCHSQPVFHTFNINFNIA